MYQGTISGAFKNALDWLHALGSREPPFLHDQVIGLISAAGGTQGLQAINTMEFAVRALRGWAVPYVVPVASAYRVFDSRRPAHRRKRRTAAADVGGRGGARRHPLRRRQHRAARPGVRGVGRARRRSRVVSRPRRCSRRLGCEFERILADAVGADLGQAGTALVPRLAALTAVAGLRDLYETDELRALPSPPTAAGLLALVDRVIAFTRAGISSTGQ